MSQTKAPLYERIGGQTAIADLVPAFYVRVLADAALAPFFKHTSLDMLHRMQQQFFGMATGGPEDYGGRLLEHVHHGRGITQHHFAKFTHHLLETLLDAGISQEDADEVIETLNRHVNEVTGTSY